MRVLVGALFVTACGRIDFEPINATDAIDPVDPGCWPQWRAGSVTFSATQTVAELDTAGYQADPWLTADGLEIYFVAGAGIPQPDTFDIFHAVRADRASAFGAPQRFALSSSVEDGKLSLSADGLTAIFASQRAPSQALDLWQATRSSTAASFDPPTQAPLTLLNGPQNDVDPHLSADGLRLYFSPNDASLVQTIAVASRATVSDAFGPPRTVEDLTGPLEVADPSLSPDELVIVYSGYLGPPAFTELFYAVRSTVGDAFSQATPIASLNTPAYEGNPFVTEDGCELWFTSTMSGAVTLYVTEVER